MWEGPEAELTLTHNAQPAILVHTLAVHAVVRDQVQPVAAAGHSLGEYAAYAALGALELADAVRLVRRRGELMLEAGTQRPGTMAAVMGLAGEQVAEMCAGLSDATRSSSRRTSMRPTRRSSREIRPAVERAGAALRKRPAPSGSCRSRSAGHSTHRSWPRAGRACAMPSSRVTFGIPHSRSWPTRRPNRSARPTARSLGAQLTAPVSLGRVDGADWRRGGSGRHVCGDRARARC